MEILAAMFLVVIVIYAGLVLLKLLFRTPGRYETRVEKVQPPEQPPEAPDWLTFHVADGTLHLRASTIQSFSYSRHYKNLIINDGTDCPVTIQDPGCRQYGKLCQQFGVLPMTKTLRKGAEHGHRL